MAEMIVDEAAVGEYLGVAFEQVARPRLRPNQVRNIGVLNAVGCRWFNGRDLLAALAAFAEANESPLLADITRQLSEATNTPIPDGRF
jgi:hypothetical protein